MNHFVVRPVSERGGDLVRLATLDAQHVGGGVVGESTCKLASRAVTNCNDVSLAKRPLSIDHADRQQALALLFERRASTVVHDKRTSRLRREADPPFPCRHSLTLGDKQRANWLAGENLPQVAGLFAAGDVTTTFGEQHLIAIGEGARAALSAYDELLPQLWVYDARPVD